MSKYQIPYSLDPNILSKYLKKRFRPVFLDLRRIFLKFRSFWLKFNKDSSEIKWTWVRNSKSNLKFRNAATKTGNKKVSADRFFWILAGSLQNPSGITDGFLQIVTDSFRFYHTVGRNINEIWFSTSFLYEYLYVKSISSLLIIPSWEVTGWMLFVKHSLPRQEGTKPLYRPCAPSLTKMPLNMVGSVSMLPPCSWICLLTVSSG